MGPRLKFCDQDDFAVAVKRLVWNSRRFTPNREVANCIICASIFALLPLSLGKEAGEARKITRVHDEAFVRDGQRFSYYERFEDHPHFVPTASFAASCDMGYLFSCSFAFIASLLIKRVARSTWRRSSAKEVDSFLEMLALAEAINPFHAELYKIRAAIYEAQYDYKNMAANETLAGAVGALKIGPNGLPSLST